MKSFLYVIAFLPIICSAQKAYYKMPDNQIFPQNVFDVFDKKFKKEGLHEMKIKERIVKKDSIIHIVEIVKVKGAKTKKPSGQTPMGQASTNPFARHKEKIGEKFDITVFQKSDNDFFQQKDIAGKPTFINFWFIKCPPCIREIPLLNKLKKEYAGKMNFLAITFDTNEKVQEFLKSKNFDFSHITNAKSQLNEMDVHAYPMNMILDKNGTIQFVDGLLSSEKEIAAILNKLL